MTWMNNLLFATADLASRLHIFLITVQVVALLGYITTRATFGRWIPVELKQLLLWVAVAPGLLTALVLLMGSAAAFLSDRNLFFLIFEVLAVAWQPMALSVIAGALWVVPHIA